MTNQIEPFPRRRFWLGAGILIIVVVAMGALAAWKLVVMQQTAAIATRLQDTITRDFRTLLDKGPKVGETFLKNIREGRLDEAYAVTTPPFRGHTTRAAFEELVKLNPPLKEDLGPPEISVGGGRLVVNFWNGNVAYSRANMDYHTRGSEQAGQKARLRLILVAEGAEAFVDELFIEGLVRGQ